MECAPGTGGIVASWGEVWARSSARDGPYQASLSVAARYASAICWVRVMGRVVYITLARICGEVVRERAKSRSRPLAVLGMTNLTAGAL